MNTPAPKPLNRRSKRGRTNGDELEPALVGVLAQVLAQTVNTI